MGRENPHQFHLLDATDRSCQHKTSDPLMVMIGTYQPAVATSCFAAL